MQVFSPEENFDDFCKFASIGQGRSVSLAERKRTHANPFRSVVSGGNYLLYIRALTREICALPISFRKRRLLRKDIGKIWPKSYVLYRINSRQTKTRHSSKTYRQSGANTASRSTVSLYMNICRRYTKHIVITEQLVYLYITYSALYKTYTRTNSPSSMADVLFATIHNVQYTIQNVHIRHYCRYCTFCMYCYTFCMVIKLYVLYADYTIRFIPYIMYCASPPFHFSGRSPIIFAFLLTFMVVCTKILLYGK